MMRQLTKWLLEPSLVLAVLALTCFGVAMIYSAGVVHIPNDVTQNAWIRQGTWFVLAVTVFKRTWIMCGLGLCQPGIKSAILP